MEKFVNLFKLIIHYILYYVRNYYTQIVKFNYNQLSSVVLNILQISKEVFKWPTAKKLKSLFEDWFNGKTQPADTKSDDNNTEDAHKDDVREDSQPRKKQKLTEEEDDKVPAIDPHANLNTTTIVEETATENNEVQENTNNEVDKQENTNNAGVEHNNGE